VHHAPWQHSLATPQKKSVLPAPYALPRGGPHTYRRRLTACQKRRKKKTARRKRKKTFLWFNLVLVVHRSYTPFCCCCLCVFVVFMVLSFVLISHFVDLVLVLFKLYDHIVLVPSPIQPYVHSSEQLLVCHDGHYNIRFTFIPHALAVALLLTAFSCRKTPPVYRHPRVKHQSTRFRHALGGCVDKSTSVALYAGRSGSANEHTAVSKT